MKKVLLLFTVCLTSFSVKSQCSELFISKYIQFGGNNKGIEIYNPTASPINLAGYSIERFKSNSSAFISTTMSDSLHLNGIIPSHGTWVVINGQTVDVPLVPTGVSPKCDSVLQSYADQLDHIYGFYPGKGQPMYFKGNDALILRKPNLQIADIFGETGVTVTYWSTLPTYRGGVGEGKWITKGYMMERKASVTSGITNLPSSFNPLAEYDTIPLVYPTMTRQDTLDTYSLFGSHTCTCSVGIQSNEKVSKLSVYPNPSAAGVVNISSTELIAELNIFSLLGNMVISDKAINKMVLAINTERISKGTYLLLVTFKNGITERKTLTIE